tara:strand:- start:5571 stop:7562 length:1992 start_codon:yes stop_codon:yes gene_type:complete
MNIMTECFFVVERVTDSMKKTGDGHGVEVMSIDEYEKSIFNFEIYSHIRSRKQFGSSVNPLTGQPDQTNFIPVTYEEKETKREKKLQDIIDDLLSGSGVILLGEYGSGKSRCSREIFQEITKNKDAYVVSVDLKSVWGLRSAEEILRRHLNDLGLSSEVDFLIRAMHKKRILFLLDGFDEVGTQAWSDDPATLKKIRRDALRGVRDLIENHSEGVLITGRDHYFNDQKEMLECLGLDGRGPKIYSSKKEFSDEEMESFLSEITQSMLVIPDWLPRRPLMCQVIASFPEEKMSSILEDENGDIEFWYKFVDVLCSRENRIGDILDKEVIRDILKRLARITRSKFSDVGPISYSEIQSAFEYVVGKHPVEDAGVLLQRLPGLGRTSSESDDRQFVDVYILDGLRAMDISESLETFSKDIFAETWRNPLDRLGQRVLGRFISKNYYQDIAQKYMIEMIRHKNSIAASDILSGMISGDDDQVNLKGMKVENGEFTWLDLSMLEPSGFTVDSSVIFNLILPQNKINDVYILNSQIEKIYGVSAESGLPNWIQECLIDSYEKVDTVSAIKNIKLSPQHRILVTILKKTFFQPGRGRQEAALLRGLGQVDTGGYTGNILKILISEGVLESARGDHGRLYIPVIKHKSRISSMLAQLNQSSDVLWEKVANL